MTNEFIKKNMNKAVKKNKYFLMAYTKISENGRLQLIPYVSFPKGINYKIVNKQINKRDFLSCSYTKNTIQVKQHQLYECKILYMLVDYKLLTEYTFEIIGKLDKEKKWNF